MTHHNQTKELTTWFLRDLEHHVLAGAENTNMVIAVVALSSNEFV
jgi:hypothetical protein